MQVSMCAASLPAAGPSNRALRSVVTLLLFAIVCCVSLPAQKFELAKISLGMTEQDAKTALGPGYQFFEQPAPNTPNVLYLYAGNPGQKSAYSFALIDGKIQGFQSFKHFAEGSYPLMETIRKSVADKLWAPQKPNGSTWISDTAGHPLADNAQIHCVDDGTATLDTGFLMFNGSKLTPAMYETLKGLLQPQSLNSNPACGVYVTVASTQLYSNPAVAIATSLRVENIAAFSALERQRRQRLQAQQNNQTKQAQQTKSPF